MSRGAVVLGKWGARMSLGAIQIAFAMITGSVLFHVHWGPNLPMVVLVLLVYGSLAAALGMLLGNFGRTEGQVIGFGVIAEQCFRGTGRLLVAHRNHAAVDAEAGPAFSHRLDHGRSAQADEFRRIARSASFRICA